jgi:hypothetical protein
MLKILIIIIKKKKTTSNAGPIICVSFAKEGKTQVGWVVDLG